MPPTALAPPNTNSLSPGCPFHRVARDVDDDGHYSRIDIFPPNPNSNVDDNGQRVPARPQGGTRCQRRTESGTEPVSGAQCAPLNTAGGPEGRALPPPSLITGFIARTVGASDKRTSGPHHAAVSVPQIPKLCLKAVDGKSRKVRARAKDGYHDALMGVPQSLICMPQGDRRQNWQVGLVWGGIPDVMMQ
jgi:hypothetical protein